MSRLPSGTVTVLFTDVEGSTELLGRLGRQTYVAALGEHRRILRDAAARHGGVEVEMQGDSFHFAFASARDGGRRCGQGQRELIATRSGAHGPAGLDVHRAARVM